MTQESKLVLRSNKCARIIKALCKMYNLSLQKATEIFYKSVTSEMIEKGIATSFEEVLANVVSRDHIDETRAESPLRRADDAIALDNSTMTLEEQDSWLMSQYEKAAESSR